MSHLKDKKHSASEEFANKCLAAVCDAVEASRGYEYISSTTEDRRKWFRLLAYCPQVEELAVLTVANFILTDTDKRPSHHSSEFIKAVLGHVATSLSQYTVKNPIYKMSEIHSMPDDTAENKMAKKQARKSAYGLAEQDILAKLIESTTYLHVIENQERRQKQDKLHKNKIGKTAYRAEKDKLQRTAKAREAYKVAQGVSAVFKEAAEYKNIKKK